MIYTYPFTYVLVSWILGIICGIFIYRPFGRQHKYVGNIVVTEKQEGIKLFSLELDGDPEKIVTQKEVTFKVLAIPNEESDRK